MRIRAVPLERCRLSPFLRSNPWRRLQADCLPDRRRAADAPQRPQHREGPARDGGETPGLGRERHADAGVSWGCGHHLCSPEATHLMVAQAWTIDLCCVCKRGEKQQSATQTEKKSPLLPSLSLYLLAQNENQLMCIGFFLLIIMVAH